MGIIWSNGARNESDFQSVVDRFEDDVLALAYYTKDRDVICGEYNLLRTFINTKVVRACYI